MPSISALVSDEKIDLPITLKSGAVVNLNVSPGYMTGEIMVEIANETDDAQSFVLICKTLAATINMWDITAPVQYVVQDEETGAEHIVVEEETLPITMENILKLPVDFILAVFSEMQTMGNSESQSEGSSFAG